MVGGVGRRVHQQWLGNFGRKCYLRSSLSSFRDAVQINLGFVQVDPIM